MKQDNNRRIIYIDTSNMSPDKKKDFLDRLKEQFAKRKRK